MYFQMNLSDILKIISRFIHAQPFLPHWLQSAVLRAGVLVVTTMLLLVARIKIMGAQLPVFTA